MTVDKIIFTSQAHASLLLDLQCFVSLNRFTQIKIWLEADNRTGKEQAYSLIH